MIVFGDEGIPEAACRMLNAFERVHEVRHLLDEFPRGTPDTEWVQGLANRDEAVAILTRDAAMLRRSGERAAIKRSGTHVVMLAAAFGRLRRDDLLIALVTGWRPLMEQLERLNRPTVIRWHHRGGKRVEIVSATDRLR